jgi:hypothetical protein
LIEASCISDPVAVAAMSNAASDAPRVRILLDMMPVSRHKDPAPHTAHADWRAQHDRVLSV